MRRVRITLAVLALLMMGIFFQNQAGQARAQYQGKVTWDRYTCNLITCKKDHHTIYFTGYGDESLGTVYAAQFTGYKRHYPVTFEYGNTWTVNTGNAGYAYGNYTIHDSIISVGDISVNFRSKSATKSVSFIKK